MKKLVLLTLIMLTLSSAAVAAAQGDSGLPVFVTLLNYQPTPAQPGDLLDVYVQLSNSQVGSGGAAAEDVTVELLDSSVFTVEGQRTVGAGTIAAGGTYVAQFRVRVNSNAGVGQRLITARVSQKSLDDQETDLSITVASDDAAVFITDVATVPAVIEPGREASVQLNVENLASARLRDITIDLNLANAPFVPIDGTAKAKIQSLAAGASAQVQFKLIAEPDATANVYKIPVDISFLDEQGTTTEQEDAIGLQVNTPANTKAYLDGVSIANGETELVIRLVNRGLSEVKFVEAVFADDAAYTIKDEDREVYVGNIDTDDWETVRVHITTDASEINLPLTYRYTDAFNTEFTVDQTFTVQIPEEQQSNAGAVNVVIVLVVIAGIVYWIIRRRKKRSK